MRTNRRSLALLIFPLSLFGILAVLLETTELDVYLLDRFYDFDTGLWAGASSYWWNTLLHETGRRLVIVVGLVALGIGIASLRSARASAWRRDAIYLTVCIVLCTGLVGLWRASSNPYCPWDLERYGGFAPRLGPFDALPEGLEPGRCFPSSHASGGFSLVGLFFVARNRRSRRSPFVLIGVLVLGGFFAVAQMARGAHFLSHSLWSLAVCWVIAWSLDALFFRTARSSVAVGEMDVTEQTLPPSIVCGTGGSSIGSV